ncbi:ParA family protein [Ferruginivarius sediminum]|uniref:ParA family protein n=1 Tax=Ferruginivarius sediminum TaxID=2661937 RepID=A0A369TDB0_9PROT|nr:ParA family protein [Ferruginivarius sediminum]RDD60906.1 ParA family protein [Ferruginivarius sediminum]
MHVLTFASQKGGSGKTTLAGHLAVQAAQSGAERVALIDTDPQGSLADWWNARDSAMPEFVHTAVGHLRADLDALEQMGMELVIIDTPPAITDTIEQVIAVSDLVAIPTRPSPHDLRAAGATVELVEACGKPLVFVVNAATMRARITGEAAVALSQHGTVAPTTMHQRTDFAASMIDGRVVGELNPQSKSAQEVRDLWTYLSGRLRGTRRETFLRTQEAGRPRKSVVVPARASA